MSAKAKRAESKLRELTPAEFYAVFDRAAQRLLGMSGQEFLAKWRNGEFAHPDELPGVMEVAALMPNVTL